MKLRKIGAGRYETEDGKWQILHQTEVSGGYTTGGWIAYKTDDKYTVLDPYERLSDLKEALIFIYIDEINAQDGNIDPFEIANWSHD